MHCCAAFIGCLFSRLWRYIVSTWKGTPGSCVIGEWFMHWTTTPTSKCMHLSNNTIQTHMFVTSYGDNSSGCDTVQLQDLLHLNANRMPYVY